VGAFRGGLGEGFSSLDVGSSSLMSGTRVVKYSYDPFGRRNSRQAYWDSGSSASGSPAPTAESAPQTRSVYDPLERGKVVVREYGNHRSESPSWWNDQQVQQYLYDGFSMNVLGQLDGSQGAQHDNRNGIEGRTSFLYLRGNGELIEQAPIARYAQVQNYYTEDILGSTLQEIGPGKSIEQSYQYTAYGVAYSGTLSDANQYGYTGKQFDPMVGLYNYGFRDYNPQRGAWTTQDPIQAGANWYAYVGENPVNLVDLLGLYASDGLPSGMLSQNDPSLADIPNMASGGCAFRTAQSVAEATMHKALTSAQIHAAVKVLQTSGAVGKDMYIHNIDAVIDDAFSRLGSQTTVTAEPSSNLAPLPNYTLVGGTTPLRHPHWRLGDSEGSWFWDPYNPPRLGTTSVMFFSVYLHRK